jgi:nucleotide-binding universal stress UspA family protein
MTMNANGIRKARNVVVGFDGSDGGRRAVVAAAEQVASGGTVHVVVAYKPLSAGETSHVWADLPAEFRGTYDALGVPQSLLTEAGAILDDLGAAHEGRLIDDDPAVAILDTAADVDADLVVVGSRGLGAIGRFVRGSVSTRVATESRTSVLIVHSAGGS